VKVRGEGILIFLNLQVLHALHGEKVFVLKEKRLGGSPFRGSGLEREE